MTSKETLIGIAKDDDLTSASKIRVLAELVTPELLRPWAEMETRRALEQFEECGLSDMEALVKAFPEVTVNHRKLARAQVNAHLNFVKTNVEVRCLMRMERALDALSDCLAIGGERKNAAHLMLVLSHVVRAFEVEGPEGRFQREMQKTRIIVDLVSLLGHDYYGDK